MLLTEFDPNPNAVINPDIVYKPIADFPETVISVFSHQLFASMAALLGGTVIAETHDADGVRPIYEVLYQGKRLGFCKGRVGAPACVGQFEDVIAFGAKRIILLGNCGVLDRTIADCGIIIPTRAIRDEGTSYHYAPAGDFIDVNTRYIPEFTAVLRKFGYPLCDRHHLDHRRLLPGDPGKGGGPKGYGRGVRGDGVRRHAGIVRFSGRGIFPISLRRGQSGPSPVGPQEPVRPFPSIGQGKNHSAGL